MSVKTTRLRTRLREQHYARRAKLSWRRGFLVIWLYHSAHGRQFSIRVDEPATEVGLRTVLGK